MVGLDPRSELGMTVAEVQQCGQDLSFSHPSAPKYHRRLTGNSRELRKAMA